MKKIVILLVFAGILVAGCGNEKKNEEATQHKNIQTSDKSASVSVKEIAPPSSDQISIKTDETKNNTVNLAAAVQEKVDPMIEKSNEQAAKIVETIHDKTEPAVRETEETSIALEEDVKEKSTPIVVSATETVTELTQKETETVRDIGSQEAAIELPEVVILENKKGNIVLPHKTHSDSFDCKTCHGENQPGPLSLGKDAGHNLCKGCHKEKNAGPTNCSGCHTKTP